MPGPAPKPESQQRRPGRGLARTATRLPVSGRSGEPPKWPLSKQTPRERAVWSRVWATPQAVAWEQLGWYDEVARYCLLLATIDARKAKAIEMIEARQLADRLGLSPMSLLRLRWEIVDLPTESEEQKVVELRSRIKAVDP